MEKQSRVSFRKKMYEIIEQGPEGSWVSHVFDYVIIFLVVTNVLAFLLETVPEIALVYGKPLEYFDLFSVLVFTLEYILRIWTSVEFPYWKNETHWKTRLRYALRPLQIIDLIVIIPFYLSFLFAIDLRVLRILRLFRLLKLTRYSLAMQSLMIVISNERRALFGAVLLMMCLLLFASTGIYFAEHNAQPDIFGSIPMSMWWAISTLTTVGYGDVIPQTTIGKLFGGIVMMFGLGMFALPIGIIATGFSHESNRRDFVVSWSLVAKVPMFSKLDANEIASLLPALNSLTYEPGEVIVHQGETANVMFFIASGQVEVDTENGPVILGNGEHFGEMALLEHRTRNHTVRADSKCRLLALEAPDFDRLMRSKPELLETIRKTARERQHENAPKVEV